MPRKKTQKKYLWLPYLTKITVSPQSVFFEYKGGSEKIKWKEIRSIMIYGQSVDLPQNFLEKSAFYKIPIIIHRRHMKKAVIISPTLPPDQENLLSQQIIFRENNKKKLHISRKLIHAKLKSTSWLVPYDRLLLYKTMKVEQVLAIESWQAKRYWNLYFCQLGINATRRNSNEEIIKILDAVSKFVSGILLRWILYHNLSPYHGFLHKPTDYPALVYDLMEPYRGFFDKLVFDTYKKLKTVDNKKKMGIVIQELKTFMDTKVYVEATRQVVTFQELLHGVVLALRSYLLGDSKRFVVPMPSKPNGGRPIKAGYKLYGHKAGITNFWPQTKDIAEKFEKTYLL